MALSQIQSLRVAAVLGDCLDQLDILGHTLMVQIGRERGTVEAPERVRLAKLRRDCQYIWQQVSTLHLELEEKQSFSSLLQVVEEEEQRKKAENVQREAKREVKQRKQALQIQQGEIEQKNEELKELSWVSKDLRYQLNEQASMIVNQRMIAEKCIELKFQQIQRETIQAEKLLEDQLELLQKQLKDEARVHEESKKFLQNQHEGLQLQLQQWQEHTQQMLQEKEQQLNHVHCKRTVNLEKLSEMRRKFKQMEQVAMEDREEQEKLRQQQAEARAATKLQAWWRGCMVRRGLGSFKKAEEDKKGKKKKDGKKKKKK